MTGLNICKQRSEPTLLVISMYYLARVDPGLYLVAVAIT